jgi:ACT domain-containing protein
MTKKSVRVQLYPEDREKLSLIALRHGCIYDNKGNLSLLLAQIASDNLEIRKPITTTKKETPSPSVPLIGIELQTLANLNGMIALVADKIAQHGGNIYEMKARDPDPFIRIKLYMPKDSNLNELFVALKQLEVKDILSFNPAEKLEKLLEILGKDEHIIYQHYKRHKNNRFSELNLLKELIFKYNNEPLITDISLIIGFRIEVKNIKGKLAQLAYKIAEKHLSILEIDQKVHSDEQKNIADLFLGFYPLSQDAPIPEIKSIQKLTKELKDLDCIEKIYQLNVEFST